MATMAVIMVGVTTRAIASDSFRWGSLTFSEVTGFLVLPEPMRSPLP